MVAAKTKVGTGTGTVSEDVDPFENLFAAAELTDKRADSRKRERAQLTVPQKYIDQVEQAYKLGKRIEIKDGIAEKALFDQVADMYRAAGDRSELDISVTVTARYKTVGDDDDVLCGLNASVGARRGGKAKTKSADGDTAE